MVSIATGSPLIRIMAKSIAGIAWGPVHASVYTSEVNSPALKQCGHLLKENQDSLQCGEACGDKLKESDRDKGGKHRDRWEGGGGCSTTLQVFLLQSIKASGPLRWINKPLTSTWRSSHRAVLPLSHVAPSALRPLCSSFRLPIPPSPSGRSEVAGPRSCVYSPYSLMGDRRGRVTADPSLSAENMALGCLFNIQQSQPANCDTATWRRLNEVDLGELGRAVERLQGFHPASGPVPGYLRRPALLASCPRTEATKPFAAHLRRERTKEAKHI